MPRPCLLHVTHEQSAAQPRTDPWDVTLTLEQEPAVVLEGKLYFLRGVSADCPGIGK